MGDAEPLARGLARQFRVVEPWQRASGGEPLTVAAHVADLHGVIEMQGPEARPAMVGHSWGAMLALAYAAAHPYQVGPLVLVGCGTFDTTSRARLQATLESRTDAHLRRKIRQLHASSSDTGEKLYCFYRLTEPLYGYDPDMADRPGAVVRFDERAHFETWNDMVRLQDSGLYPAAFASIVSPILMLHGAYDPHPGQMIRDVLKAYIPQLEYRQWERCGHKPWMERQVRDEFFSVMAGWLTAHL
jgi:pimeloyl-ACP methyl ester carboxylesterase